MAQHNIVDLTYSQLQSLIGSNGIVRGILYNITNAQASHNESVPTKVIVQGITPNMVTEDGVRFQLIPDYNALPIWNEGLTSYNIGDKCIYGSRVWVNVSGDLGKLGGGQFPSYLIELSNDWEQVPYVEGIDYSLIQLNCKYDVVNDLITLQEYGGLLISISKNTITSFSFSPIDYCDWGQTNTSIIRNVKCIIFLNNANLNYCFNVSSEFIMNNTVLEMQNISTASNKLTSSGDSLPENSIAYNNCTTIKSIVNASKIFNIPDTVNEYSFVTDDESGYIEHDFSSEPMSAGTHVIGCILNKGVSITEVVFNGEGLTSGVNISFGIATDDPTKYATTSAAINTIAQRDTAISARTGDYNRELLLTLDAPITAGQLRLVYKYL